jgi:DNA-directed RNA polymerase sigma subunit (sigma70/sigma32)
LDNSGGFTLEELAEKYNLTKDQVRYKLKTILETLQKTAN